MNWEEAISQGEMRDLESRGLTIQYILQNIAKNKRLSEIIEECLVNPPEGKGVSLQWVQKGGLVQKYSNIVEKMLNSFSNSMIPLYEISHVLEKTLQLDVNWMKATICLAAQDAASKKIAEKSKISTVYVDSQTGKSKFKPARFLLNEIAEKLEGTSEQSSKMRASLKAATAYADEFRNRIVHEGTPIDSKTASRVSEVTKSLLEDFFLSPHSKP